MSQMQSSSRSGTLSQSWVGTKKRGRQGERERLVASLIDVKQDKKNCLAFFTHYRLRDSTLRSVALLCTTTHPIWQRSLLTEVTVSIGALLSLYECLKRNGEAFGKLVKRRTQSQSQTYRRLFEDSSFSPTFK